MEGRLITILRPCNAVIKLASTGQRLKRGSHRTAFVTPDISLYIISKPHKTQRKSAQTRACHTN